MKGLVFVLGKGVERWSMVDGPFTVPLKGAPAARVAPVPRKAKILKQASCSKSW